MRKACLCAEPPFCLMWLFNCSCCYFVLCINILLSPQVCFPKRPRSQSVEIIVNNEAAQQNIGGRHAAQPDVDITHFKKRFCKRHGPKNKNRKDSATYWFLNACRDGCLPCAKILVAACRKTFALILENTMDLLTSNTMRANNTSIKMMRTSFWQIWQTCHKPMLQIQQPVLRNTCM